MNTNMNILRGAEKAPRFFVTEAVDENCIQNTEQEQGLTEKRNEYNDCFMTQRRLMWIMESAGALAPGKSRKRR